MEVIWNSKVKQEIRPFAIGLGVIKNVQVAVEPKGLELIQSEVFEFIKKQFSIETIKETPVVKAYRSFYWKFLKIDPTKTRPSGEALVRRFLRYQRIPIISNIVFAINLASIQTQLSFSGFDLNKIVGSLEIRYAKPGEEFQGLGTRHRLLTGNELLLADKEKILCIYAYGDAALTKVSDKTRDILLVNYGVPNISADLLQRGIELGLKYIHATAGGKIGKIKTTMMNVHPGL
ncbi:MAG: B3/B4 domain-containing protein [Candidatus Helarchaeota archaeon]